MTAKSSTNEEITDGTEADSGGSQALSLINVLASDLEKSQALNKKQKKDIAKLDLDVKDIKQRSDDLSASIDGIKQDISSASKQSVEMLGVFVAFFTFVSVEFQLFKIVESGVMAIAISAFLLGSLLLFAYAIHVFFKLENEQNKSHGYTVLVVALLLLGGACYLFYSQNPVIKSQKAEVEMLRKHIDNLTASSSAAAQDMQSLRDDQINLRRKNPYLK